MGVAFRSFTDILLGLRFPRNLLHKSCKNKFLWAVWHSWHIFHSHCCITSTYCCSISLLGLSSKSCIYTLFINVLWILPDFIKYILTFTLYDVLNTLHSFESVTVSIKIKIDLKETFPSCTYVRIGNDMTKISLIFEHP